MKSLFLRLLFGLWGTMAVLVGVFALIHAWSFPDEGRVGWREITLRSARLRAESALACADRAGESCDAVLAPIEERDQRVAIYRDGAILLGEAIDGGPELARRAEDAADGRAQGASEGVEQSALRLPGRPGTVVVAVQRRPSSWMFFLVPETLPWRLLSIVVVTGLVSVLLARALSRPLRTLRAAASSYGAGDFSVRVSPGLTGADDETRALGEELDRMAERIRDLLEAQRRLLRDVSHELRSPLARLGIALELVRRKSPPDAHEALGRIEREAERLNEMIGELLTLARLDSGEGAQARARVELSDLLADLAGDVAFEAEQRGVRVERAIAPALAVTGDAELLRRALENVLRNAVRFSPDDAVVEVSLAAHGASLRAVVRDHGPGVPEEALRRIFEPFFRVAGDRARQAGGGTGIGLAITHSAIVAHGGEVRAENAEGGGLRVTIDLPRAPG